MGPERLDRARTVESIAAVTASSRPPWAGAVLVRYPPRAAGLAAGAAVGLPGAPAGGRGELVFPAVDSGGRSVGAGRCNRPCVACIGIAPARGHPTWTGLRRGLPQTGRIKPVGLVERGADPATGKKPRHGSSYRRGAGWAWIGLGAVTLAASVVAGLLGPIAIAACAVVLSLPTWAAWSWLAYRG